VETEFSFLWLCEDHWKANQVTTNSYSQWYQHATERKSAVEAKKANKRATEQHEAIAIEVDASENENDSENPSKRSGDDAPP
jgi:uncharacterized protein YaiL (DUF2058 family)